MPSATSYAATLRALPTNKWEAYLLANSGLPGPRANLALAQSVADLGDEALFRRLIKHDAASAPTNFPAEFLALCGTIGFGRLLVEHHPAALDTLRQQANDPRWRVREGVAMAFQRLGDHDFVELISLMEDWANGTAYEQRAAAAALCEPRLLKNPAQVARVLGILDTITASIPAVTNRKADDFLALRKGLAYCWSVAVAAHPDAGKPLMEKWLASSDKDILWLMRENLKKDRLKRMDAAWVGKFS
ncbi:MAG: HEAT repeat domain-containing protein [Chloroflexi bacterium]|nr:HEAT repeat domain-containing protein [Chloroflexota bacterium]MCC6894748.1 HEAT repeat domain-containing protein [Anaerolineae bacterium]